MNLIILFILWIVYVCIFYLCLWHWYTNNGLHKLTYKEFRLAYGAWPMDWIYLNWATVYWMGGQVFSFGPWAALKYWRFMKMNDKRIKKYERQKMVEMPWQKRVEISWGYKCLW